MASKFADPIIAILSNPDYTLMFLQLCTQFLIWWQQNANKMKLCGGYGMFLIRQEGDGPARLTIHGKDNKSRYTYCIYRSVEYRLAVYLYIIKELRPAK
jgi:hypothetical protein